MTVYQFLCNYCGHRFHLNYFLHMEDDVRCPICHDKGVRELGPKRRIDTDVYRYYDYDKDEMNESDDGEDEQ